MFRAAPQAFLAIPQAPSFDALRTAIREALERHGLQVFEPQHTPAPADLAYELLDALRQSEVVVADLSGSVPEILFEVGYALSSGQPLLLLSQESPGALPSFLQAFQVAMYKPGDLEKVEVYVDRWLKDHQGRRQAATP